MLNYHDVDMSRMNVILSKVPVILSAAKDLKILSAVAIVAFLGILGINEVRAEETAGGILFKEVYAAPPVAYQTVAVTSVGTISGMVKFTGQATNETLPVTKDQSVCGGSKVSERLMVSASGG